jgi:hypothetical protein
MLITPKFSPFGPMTRSSSERIWWFTRTVLKKLCVAKY